MARNPPDRRLHLRGERLRLARDRVSLAESRAHRPWRRGGRHHAGRRRLELLRVEARSACPRENGMKSVVSGVTCLALTAVISASAQQRGAFMMRTGNDTISIERFDVHGDTIQGSLAVRGP